MTSPLVGRPADSAQSQVPAFTVSELALRTAARDPDVVAPGANVLVELIPDGNNDHSSVDHDLPFLTFVRESRAPGGRHIRGRAADNTLPYADLVVPDALLPDVIRGVRTNPEASLVLAQLMRATGSLPIPDAIRAESLAYSLLQTGAEFAKWLAHQPARTPDHDMEPTVLVHQGARASEIQLNRPSSANAVNTRMRTELVGILSALALTEGPLELTGNGRHFCAGGDLREFGMARYPLGAHVERISQNVPGSVARVADRLTSRVHGACVGAGMEIASFAGHVTAAPDTSWRLPEVSMGLLPGCGGTVSIPRRIGRQRTLLLAVTGMKIDAAVALEWGLIDEVSE
ncbi:MULTISPECIES: enoyl-CoA hydratase/isomerase family protein [Arthrobacter]|uniref:Enoyl-CoA hydratase/isomerase family protein n=1 Tax=Arthrobacter terricola TaxID=2547396 RepID=A0A4R5L0Y8_9MICC|nr:MULTISPECIES: enoyl-CoA hydratase/isomerase family protein [Arthrobacter]MBT8159570.1 enoyl-CoA hydratase/isomerase family protein [Arthrobacter sp. GN70]TDG01309.1 enoyl-CoA hydratase/isomerase family protein [Arthrobacter terricola]